MTALPYDRTDNDGRPLPISHCPDCGYQLDCATEIKKGYRPRPGSVSLCFKCTTFLVYDDTMHLVALSPTTWQQLPRALQERLFAARQVIHDQQTQPLDGTQTSRWMSPKKHR